MRIAVTGGTGFLGQNTISHLIEGGHQVQAWYRGSRPPAQSGVDWIPGQLNDPQATEELIGGCDAVVHMAVARTGQSFMRHPDDAVAYFQSNVIGTLRLIEAAAGAGVERFVFLSSGAVHQKVADDLPLDERHPLWPASMYGANKASIETLVHAYGFSNRLKIATLRPVSIVGIDDPIENSKWFDLTNKIMGGEQVDVSGGGKIVPVGDVARAIDCLLRTDQSIAGETFNCSAGFYSDHQIASWVKTLTNSDAELVGPAKKPGREMQTSKLQSLGMRFSGEAELRELLGAMVQRLA
jgi:nucleoside-diphosphate-sugar epimerase